MKRREYDEPAADICERVRQVQRGEICDTVAGVLDEATKHDTDALKPMLPTLSTDREWLTRVSTVELIGDFQLTSFLKLVRARLEDRNSVVRGYALTACYDLLGKKAVPVIMKGEQTKDVRNRVTALALDYIETQAPDVLTKLRHILLRRNCHFGHRYVVMNTFDHYLDMKYHPEIIALFEDVLNKVRSLPKNRRNNMDKGIADFLDRWKGVSAH